MNRMGRVRSILASLAGVAAILAGSVTALLGACGPFTDVAADIFCPFVLEIFYLGITTGTTATTYDPAGNVTRLQMAAFLSRTVDGVLKRGSRRASLDQFWTPQGGSSVGLTTLGGDLTLVRSDGKDLWVADDIQHRVSRVRASDGKLLETWTGASGACGVLVAMGKVIVTSNSALNLLYRIDPAQPAGAVTTVATNMGSFATGIAFDGSLIWTANQSGSVSIVTPSAALPWTVTNVSTGFVTPVGAVFDGANVWITDRTPQRLVRLGAGAAITATAAVGPGPQFPIYDGANIWVPNGNGNSLTVVRASTASVLATLTGNGLNLPGVVAFDGQRILVTNELGNSVSLWKAADLTPLGSAAIGAGPFGACSDGVNFWITLEGSGHLARF